MTCPHLPPDEATARLIAGETPDAMLIARGLVPLNVSPEQLGGVSRLAVASAGSRAEAEDGLSVGVFLPLPASLAEVEHTLRWLAWDGDQVARSSSNDARADFA